MQIWWEIIRAEWDKFLRQAIPSLFAYATLPTVDNDPAYKIAQLLPTLLNLAFSGQQFIS